MQNDLPVRELNRLRDDKAAGADDLVPRFLSKIKEDISYPLILMPLLRSVVGGYKAVLLSVRLSVCLTVPFATWLHGMPCVELRQQRTYHLTARNVFILL